MELSRQTQLLQACRVLFGHELDLDFLDRLQDTGVRVAYRHRAFATHPDRVQDQRLKGLHTERFIEINGAYTLLRDFVRQRGRPSGHASAVKARTAHRPPAPRTARPPAHHPFAGMPRRRLRLGEFLYHSRTISFETLIRALIWQRGQRDRFGEISRRWGYMSQAQIRSLLAGRRPLERFGEAARRLFLLTEFQVHTIISFQRLTQPKIGAFFVAQGHLPPHSLAELLERLKVHNAAYPPHRS